MQRVEDAIFVVLEYDKNLPKLDLHGSRSGDVEREIINFISKQMLLGSNKIQIVYGRGGKGILREKTKEVLAINMAEKDPNKRFVKAWKEAVLEGAGGRCLVVLED
jgi:DNA-nicking Smr family endonuclease